jgi:hypothetical protein
MTDETLVPIEPLASHGLDWNEIMKRDQVPAKTALLLSIAISLKRIADQGDRVELVEEKHPTSGHPDGWFTHDGDRAMPIILHDAHASIEVELVTDQAALGPPIAFAWQNIKRWRITT